MKHWMRHPSLTLAISAALALASGSAAALGLGQIEVRSRAGQPFVAEIPIVSTTPGEVEQLQARLASPETFARVGLQPPQGAVTDLQFTVTQDRAGRPVILVTTSEPVEQPLLTFLVEVDWGQGRLVREYSALVDTPRAVAAPAQPPIQAPEAAPSNTVQRPVVVAAPPVPAPQRPAADREAGAPERREAAGEYGPVRRGESLSQIASRLGLADGSSLNQAMIALLRANPDAFINGDINQLKRGAVLRVPDSAEVAAVDAAQASQIVRDRMRQWREARRQAVVAPDQAASAGAAPPSAGQPARSPAASVPDRSTATTQSAPAPGARLEIVPPAASRAAQAGTQSGIQAGGEGQMLRQELQQTQETLAARDAELQELKSRVAELEKLQADQQRLIALKDSELAAAQQRGAAAGTTEAAAPTPAEAPARDSLLPWLLGGAALLLVLVGAWWARRRRTPAPASSFRAPSRPATSDLAAAFPLRRERATDEDPIVVRADGSSAPAAAPVMSKHADSAHDEAPVDARGDAGAVVGAEDAARVERGAPPSREEWTGPDLAREDAEPVEDVDASAPTWHATAAPAIQPAAPVPPMPLVEPATPKLEPTGAPVNERIELAQAYMDLGDYDSARQLLGEVAVTGDHASRQSAQRMLRSLE